MTRAEAIALRSQVYSGDEEHRKALAAADIDHYVARGALKLDDPTITPEKKFCEILSSAGLGGIQQRAVIDGLYSAGLLIVEKGNQHA